MREAAEPGDRWACPDDLLLTTLLAGGLAPAERDALHAHIDRCARCRELLANLARFQATPAGNDVATVASHGHTTAAGQARRLEPGARVGHFVVLEAIGEGGMGTVFAAHDALLGRRVALKLVKLAARDDEESSQRLVREAQAMAAISHPNVVTVHEVGRFGDQVFLAMELVDGGTLAGWLAAAERRWSEVLRMFVAAGRGLAAAHEAGLVHRDFKPQNVLVTTTGRVCVTDFGLVQAEGTRMSDGDPRELAPDDWSTTLTEPGKVMGTPRYMAPEQLLGGDTDPRTDQFAFCVALFEALHHRHPFGDSLHAWAARPDRALHEPEGGGVPRRIRRAIRRGLAADPGARHETMTALLDELEATLRRRRDAVRFAIGALAIGGAVSIGFAAARSDAKGPCTDASSRQFGESWRAPARRDAVRDATSVGTLGEQTWPRVAAQLDAYTEEGQRLVDEVCSGHDGAEGSKRVLAERSLDCLATREQTLAAAVDFLVDAGPSEALDVIYGLLPLDSCLEVSARASVPAPPRAAVAEQVAAIVGRVSAATVLAWAGRPADAVARLEALLPDAEALGYAPLVAQVHDAWGRAAMSTDVEAAIEHLRTAHAIALREGADLELVSTMSALASALAERGDDGETAAWMLDEVDAWRARLGLGEHPDQALVRATIARGRGDLSGAIALGEHAVLLADRPHEGPRIRAFAHGSLGAMYAEQRDLDRARQHSEIAVEIAATTYGPAHRRTLRGLTNLAGIELRLGHYDVAAAHLRDVLAAYEATDLADLPEAAVTLTMLGMIARQQGYAADALAYDERALAIRERVFGEVHPLVAECLEKVALDHLEGPDRPAAVATLRRAVSLRQRLHPAEHPAIGLVEIQLSRALRAAGEPTAAASIARAAVTRLAAALDADDARLYAPWLYTGMAMLEIGDFDRAAQDLDHAHALGEIAKLTAFDWAELDFARSRAMARGDRSVAAARDLAEAARRRLAARNPAEQALAAEIERWLAAP